MGLCSGKLPDAPVKREGYKLVNFVHDAMLPVEGYCFRLPPAELDHHFTEKAARINAVSVLSLYQKGRSISRMDLSSPASGDSSPMNATPSAASGMRSKMSRIAKTFSFHSQGSRNGGDDTANAICFFHIDRAEVENTHKTVVDLSEDEVIVSLQFLGRLKGIARPKDDPDTSDSDEEKALDSLMNDMAGGGSLSAHKNKRTGVKAWATEAFKKSVTFADFNHVAHGKAAATEAGEKVDVVAGTWTLKCRINCMLEREGVKLGEDGQPTLQTGKSYGGASSMCSSMTSMSNNSNPGVARTIKIRCSSLIIDASQEGEGDPVQQSWLPAEDILRDIEASLNSRLHLSLKGLESQVLGTV